MTDFEKASVDERAQSIQDLLALQNFVEAKARLEALLAPDAADVITALEGDLSM